MALTSMSDRSLMCVLQIAIGCSKGSKIRIPYTRLHTLVTPLLSSFCDAHDGSRYLVCLVRLAEALFAQLHQPEQRSGLSLLVVPMNKLMLFCTLCRICALIEEHLMPLHQHCYGGPDPSDPAPTASEPSLRCCSAGSLFVQVDSFNVSDGPGEDRLLGT